MFLGVDIGTGGTRAVVVTQDGTVRGSHAADHGSFDTPEVGWAEQHPDVWWRASQAAIAGALRNANVRANDIAAIGLTGQMHGAVMLDADGAVLRPALLWCDQRTQPECDLLHERIGRARLIHLVANPALPNFTLTKLLWVERHQPEIFARIRHVLCPKDYIRYRLSGVFAMDLQEASGTLLLDVRHRRWSAEVAEAAGVPLSWLPELFEGPEVCARVSESGAAACGLSAGTPIVAGAGDQGAGAVGMGIVTPGSVSSTIGTSGVVFAATDAPVLDPAGRLHTFCHAVPGRWHTMGVTNGAGLSLRYFRDQFAPGESYDRLAELAATAEPGCRGLQWVPYLFGERTPHLDPEARAAFTGISAAHTRADFIRAVMEGVAYSLNDTFTLFHELGIPVERIRLGGGGAHSPLWRQIQADVYGRPVEQLAVEEGPALGAALLAGVGVGAWPSVDAACEATVHLRETIAPVAADAMAAAYAQWRRIYPALRAIRGEVARA